MRKITSVVAFGILAYAKSASAGVVNVDDATKLVAAIAAAKPGDEIVLADGKYALAAKVSCSANGTKDQPIIVRAANPLGAKIESNTIELFAVTGANWHFEGLDVKGVCANDADCEHAFHVTAGATDFVLRKNRIVDFNAQLKVNAAAGGAMIPHAGLVESNELFDAHARNTGSPVTKLNIDTGDGWIVRANYIHDYARADGTPVYGAFMKSGGKNGLFERNLVLCEKDLKGTETRIGLSFGGGGTGAEFCAPKFDPASPCLVEHDGGTMRNNIIASCTDVGIYLNRAKNTKALFNTLIATTGIDFRFDTTSGTAAGNVLTGKIRDRESATHTDTNNLTDVAEATFTAMYVSPLTGDLTKKGDLGALLGKAPSNADVPDDYCARTRTGQWDLGALQHSLGDCATTTPVPGSSSSSGSVGGDGGPSSSSSSSGGTGGNGDASANPGATPGSNPSGDDDGGCDCRAASGPVGWPLGLGFLALFALRRRR